MQTKIRFIDKVMGRDSDFEKMITKAALPRICPLCLLRYRDQTAAIHSLLAFVADIEVVANFWFRSGDARTAHNFKDFLDETLSFFEEKRTGLLRLDVGFYSGKIFDYLEEDSRKINCSRTNSPLIAAMP
ncbi:MAG: hypothetical protein LBR10_00075 [Prevotellaceae bacterium]|jgi:hypothetical protein|nr:hypothetical protein [Prevotellaceae bacterium]